MHVRINRNLPADEFSNLLSQRLAATAGGQDPQPRAIDLSARGRRQRPRVMFHLDIAESVDQRLDGLMFQLLAQGCLVTQGDGVGGGAGGAQPKPRVWWWDPATTGFAVELSSSRLLRRLPSLQWLPHHRAEASPASLVVDPQGLFHGFGPRDFSSVRADGTVVSVTGGDALDGGSPRGGVEETKGDGLGADAPAAATPGRDGADGADSFLRLDYVCTALDLFFGSDGKLAPDFESVYALTRSLGQAGNRGEATVGAARCFEVLARAMKASPASVNYWTLWAFVNVMYYQV